MVEFKKSDDGRMQYSKEELDSFARQGIDPNEILQISQKTFSNSMKEDIKFAIDSIFLNNKEDERIITAIQIKKIMQEMSANDENTIFPPTTKEKQQGEMFSEIGTLLDMIAFYWNKFLKEGDSASLEKLNSKKKDLEFFCFGDMLKQYSILSEDLENVYQFLMEGDEESFREFLKIRNKLLEYLGGSQKHKREEIFNIDGKKVGVEYLMHECFSALESTKGRVIVIVNPN